MMMKMAAVATVAQLLLLCSISAFADDACSNYAKTGGSIILPLGHKLQDSDRLNWNHDKTVIVTRKSKDVFITGKKEDVADDGSLKLTNLTRSSSGTYIPSVYDKDGRKQKNFEEKHYTLCVLDPVPKPKVVVKCDQGAKKVTFTCTVDQAEDLRFEWVKDKVKLSGKGYTNKNLTEDAKTVEKNEFRCNVSNKASFETSVAVKQNCIKNEFYFPEEILGINIWIIIGGGGGIVVLLIVLVIFCCIRNRRKKSMQVKEEEELRLGWTSSEQQQHHHHHHHHQHNHPTEQHHHHQHQHQQQPAGHTGPRQHRSKQRHSRASEHPNGHPHPSPRRPAQAPKPPDTDDDQPPPLPQPRKKAPKTPRA